MVDFANGNLCGASKELNDILSKFVDAKTEIESKLNDPASTAAAAFGAAQNEINSLTSKLQTVSIPTLPKLNLQAEIGSLLSQVPGSVGYALAAAKIALEFKDDIEAKGLTLETLVSLSSVASDAICKVVPNLEKEAGSTEPAVEKPPAVKKPNKPAEPETASVVVQNEEVEKDKVEIEQKTVDFDVSPTPPEEDTGAFKVTKVTKEVSVQGGGSTTTKAAEPTKGNNVVSGGGFIHKTKHAREYVKFADIKTSDGFLLEFAKLQHSPTSVKEIYIYPQFAIRDFLITPTNSSIAAGNPVLAGQMKEWFQSGRPPYYESEYGPHMVLVSGDSLGFNEPEIKNGSIIFDSAIKLEGDHPGNVTSVKSLGRRRVGNGNVWIEKTKFSARINNMNIFYEDANLNKRFGGYAAYISYSYLDNYDADIAV
jgi:hypothetical protein